MGDFLLDSGPDQSLSLSLIAHDVVSVRSFMKTLLFFYDQCAGSYQMVQVTDVKRNAVHFHAGNFVNQVNVCQMKPL